MPLDLSVDIEASLGRVADKLDRDFEDRRREREIARARVPMMVRLQNNATIPTPTVPIGINFGGPDAGFDWLVRRIIVGGLTWTTTAAGTAEVYVTGLGSLHGSQSSTGGSVANVRALSDLVDQANSLPNKAFYGYEELVVKENESLVVVIQGGTQAQQYVASVSLMAVRTTAGIATALQGI